MILSYQFITKGNSWYKNKVGEIVLIIYKNNISIDYNSGGAVDTNDMVPFINWPVEITDINRSIVNDIKYTMMIKEFANNGIYISKYNINSNFNTESGKIISISYTMDIGNLECKFTYNINNNVDTIYECKNLNNNNVYSRDLVGICGMINRALSR